MQTFFSDILHVISQALLIPDIILLIGLIAYALFSIGSILVEWATEHRRYSVKMPQFLSSLSNASETLIPSVIEESGLLRRQREALMTVYEYRNLPGDALVALVRRLMTQEEAHYNAITSRNNMAARVAPMLGLVGTLIPLGPGIQALGQADTEMLSSSLLVAFDTTVAGLVAAAVCLVVGKIRSVWYDNYLSALDSAMATLVQKIEDDRTPDQQPSSQTFNAFEEMSKFNNFNEVGNQDFLYTETIETTTAGVSPSGMPLTPTPEVPVAPYVDAGAGQYATTPSGMPINPDYSQFIDPSQGGIVFEPARRPVNDDPFSVD